MTTDDNFWDELITYSADNAIQDGFLFPVDSIPEIAPLPQEAGIKVPVIFSYDVYNEAVKVHEQATKNGEDIRGRAWDILFLLASKARQSDEERLVFDVRFTGTKGLTTKTFWAVVDPDSQGRPQITVLFPEEC